MRFKFQEAIWDVTNPQNLKVKEDERYLCKTSQSVWFLVKRVGQRSWVAICVAEKTEADYNAWYTQTLNGNASNIMEELFNAYGIENAYEIKSKKAYRMAMISIFATGSIDTAIDVEVA